MADQTTPPFDVAIAHRNFAVDCFNRTWDYLDKSQRTADENEAMILCAAASLWHWMQRADCTKQNLSIGHWQLSRAHALAGHGDDAMRHALRSLAFADGGTPFYVGFAHEALARAAAVLSDQPAFASHLEQANIQAAKVAIDSDRAILVKDLQALAAGFGSPCTLKT